MFEYTGEYGRGLLSFRDLRLLFEVVLWAADLGGWRNLLGVRVGLDGALVINWSVPGSSVDDLERKKIGSYCEQSPWRNGLACWTSNPKVVGSSPTGGVFTFVIVFDRLFEWPTVR